MRRPVKAKKPEPKAKPLTLPEKKADGIWLFVHEKGSQKVMAQGSLETCLRFLQDRFLMGQYDEGHILISKWKNTRKVVEVVEPEPVDEELPPDYHLD